MHLSPKSIYPTDLSWAEIGSSHLKKVKIKNIDFNEKRAKSTLMLLVMIS